MRKVAVITGCGMDSKTLSHILLRKGYDVIMTFRRNTHLDLDKIQSFYSHDINSTNSLSFEFLELTDEISIRNVITNVLKKFNKIDEFYNLAAQSHVGDSFLNPMFSVKTNGESVYHILENIRTLTPSTKVYHASTSELFGGDLKYGSYDENSKFDPHSPYANGKLLGYHWIQYFRRTFDLYCCTGTLFNHSNNYRHKSFFIRRLTNAAAQIALGKTKDIKFGNLNFYRDEHFSDFGCEAMWKMLNNDFGARDYVISTNETHHGEEFLELAFGHFGLTWQKYVKIDQSRFRPLDVPRLLGNSDKASKEIDWNPNRMTFKQHIDVMCDWDYNLNLGKNMEYPDYLSLFP